MDAIVNYLPSPADRSYDFVQAYAANRDLCSLVFKIQNDPQRGPLTFVRIYSGHIEAVKYRVCNYCWTISKMFWSL